MAWTIPDKGEGQNDIQSILFQEHLDVLVAGVSGSDFVCDGCAVTAQGTPDMTVAVAAGVVCSNDGYFSVTAGNVTISTANATNPRIDLVVVDSSGAKQARAGTAAAAPKPPARTANDVVLASVFVPANDTTISTDQITDMRIARKERPRVKALGADHAISSTTATEVTGLGPMVLEAGTYMYRFDLIVQSATTTVGIGLGVNFTGTAATRTIELEYPSTGTTAITGVVDDVGAGTGQTVEHNVQTGFTTTAPNMINTAGFATAAANCRMTISGVLVVTAVGDLELWHSSETATSTTVKAGSSVWVQRTG